MLDKDEREALREIERRTSAADPDLAALLRSGRSRVRRKVARRSSKANRSRKMRVS